MTSFQRKLMCIKRKQGHCKLLYKPHNKELKSLHVFVFDFSSKIILGRGCIFITAYLFRKYQYFLQRVTG